MLGLSVAELLIRSGPIFGAVTLCTQGWTTECVTLLDWVDEPHIRFLQCEKDKSHRSFQKSPRNLYGS